MQKDYQNPRPFAVIGGRGSESFAEEIARTSHIESIDRHIETFPNGEIGVEIKQSVRGAEVYVIQTFIPTKINDGVMELLLLADAIKRAGAEKIYAVLRIYPYARQDRRETNKKNRHKRRPISARLIADLISLKFDGIIALDLHLEAIEGFFKGIVVENIIPLGLFTNYLRENQIIRKNYKDNAEPVLVAPDSGSGKKVADYAENLGLSYAVVNKVRVDSKNVVVKSVIGEVSGRPCIIIDDITATGGTLIQAQKALIERGATDVYAMVTHLEARTMDDLAKLAAAGFKKIVVTDSISVPENLGKYPVFEVLPLAAMVGKVIKNVYECTSLQPVVYDESEGHGLNNHSVENTLH